MATVRVHTARASRYWVAGRALVAKTRPPTRTTTRAVEGFDAQAVAWIATSFASPVLMGLWLVEKKGKDEAIAELEAVKANLTSQDSEVTSLQTQVASLQKELERMAFLEKRLDEAQKDQLKLERALELKDGQLESFVTVATRQIKMLEQRCTELQNWEPGV